MMWSRELFCSICVACTGNHAYKQQHGCFDRAILLFEREKMNTIRKLLELHLDEIRDCLDRAYQSIEQFQLDRNNAQLETNMIDQIMQAEKTLAIFKPYIPEYKQRYFNILNQYSHLGLTTRDIIMTFDRMVYELHTRLEKNMTSSPDMQAWSPLMKAVLDGRRAIPDQQRILTAQDNLEFITSGKTVVGGYVQSSCTIMEDYSSIENIKQGDILVSRMTTPDIICAFDRISGIVTEQGGLFCHAAVVAREFNIPCVVGCGDFINNVKNGETIILDADNGIVLRKACKPT